MIPYRGKRALPSPVVTHVSNFDMLKGLIVAFMLLTEEAI